MDKTYIFDLDGTLIDSMAPAVKTVLDLLDERGFAYPDNIVDIMMPLGFQGIARYFAKEFPFQETPEALYALIIEREKRLYANEVQAKPKVIETLRALKARGERLNVLTASPHAFLDPCLQRLGVAELFDNLFSCEDFQMSKGEKAIYEEVAKRLGKAPNDCCMVDDNQHALRAAKTAGLQTIAVYDSFSAQHENVIRSFADGYVYRMDELLAVK